jgi:hypothetical protein
MISAPALRTASRTISWASGPASVYSGIVLTPFVRNWPDPARAFHSSTSSRTSIPSAESGSRWTKLALLDLSMLRPGESVTIA